MFSRSFLPANTTLQTLTGRITIYHNEKRYGFIKTADNESFFFHYDRKEQSNLKQRGVKNAMHRFTAGDEVEFQLKPDDRHTDKMQAYNIMYKSNCYRSELIESAAENKTLEGTLIRHGNDFFVRHLKADISVPVRISGWEIDLPEVYDARIGTRVEFKLNPAKHLKRLAASLTHCRFCKEYISLSQLKESGFTTTAVITGKNWQGMYATVLDGAINAFVPMPRELDEEQRYNFFRFNKGDKVKVKIKNIQSKNKNVSLLIAE
jgi:cold shock CspA family protein